MTEDDSNNVDMDLDEFEKDFFQTRELEPEQADGPTEEEDDTPTEEVSENEDDNPLATDEPEEEEEVEETPKPKKNSAQQRIERLLERERLANERADALERRLAALEASKEVKAEPEPTPLREQLTSDAPNPDATGEDGEPVYPLGEFDPKYIRDLTRYTIKVETQAAERAKAEQEAAAAKAAERNTIAEQWVAKVDEAEAELPDIRERLAELGDVFGDVDPSYGEYLATTVMQSEFGPQIMYYLSQNIGEAQRIVASGPAAATLALGRLEARFEKPAREEKRNTKVSHAPEPPAVPTRGAQGKFKVNGDTDDLDAFEREFFKR